MSIKEVHFSRTAKQGNDLMRADMNDLQYVYDSLTTVDEDISEYSVDDIIEYANNVQSERLINWTGKEGQRIGTRIQNVIKEYYCTGHIEVGLLWLEDDIQNKVILLDDEKEK